MLRGKGFQSLDPKMLKVLSPMSLWDLGMVRRLTSFAERSPSRDGTWVLTHFLR